LEQAVELAAVVEVAAPKDPAVLAPTRFAPDVLDGVVVDRPLSEGPVEDGVEEVAVLAVRLG
jgi:hypothetical protein